jgi:sarcosine oxidase subunit beta
MRRLTLAQHWTGVEAQSIDGNPFIGRTPIEGLYVATGFSNHGFQVSPAVGAHVAAEIAGEAQPLPSFALERAGSFGAESRARFLSEPYLLEG